MWGVPTTTHYLVEMYGLCSATQDLVVKLRAWGLPKNISVVDVRGVPTTVASSRVRGLPIFCCNLRSFLGEVLISGLPANISCFGLGFPSQGLCFSRFGFCQPIAFSGVVFANNFYF